MTRSQGFQLFNLKIPRSTKWIRLNNYKVLLIKVRELSFSVVQGVSTESNIPDFRSSDGIYSLKLGRHFTAEQLVSRTMFERYPEDFFDFYKKVSGLS